MTVVCDQQKRRFRFSLQECFWFQLLIIPAFLSPFYYHFPERRQPYFGLLAFLIIPMCYTAAFACRSVLRVVRRPKDVKRSIVFAALRSGALFGMLFSVMAFGPLAVLKIYDKFAGLPQRVPALFMVQEFLEVLAVSGFVLLHFLVIGSLAGGVMGLAVDRLRILKRDSTGSGE